MIIERTLTVGVRDGLHARPASELVRLAKAFQSTIEIERGDQRANAKSSVKIMLLGVKEADEVVVKVTGDDAGDALEQVSAFLTGTGPEETIATGKTPAAITSAAGGIAASEGVALGPVFLFLQPDLPEHASRITPNHTAAEQAVNEIGRFEAALAATLDAMTVRAADPAAASARSILEALTEVAADPDWAAGVIAEITRGTDAVAAVLTVGRDLAAQFEALSDPYARARAEDIRSVVRAVAGTLLGIAAPSLRDVPPGAIVVADELSAMDLAGAPLARIAGLLCRQGAATSHAAIVARSHGIPAVFGYGGPLTALQAARTVALDGGTGTVCLDPDAATADAYRQRIAERQATAEALKRFRMIAPVTRDGRAITVAANLGSLADIPLAQEAGAMGVGLFRTELLFMERATLPDEDEQAAIYTEAVQAFSPYPVIIRTLDIGGDKPVRGIAFPPEENPFLGWRGVRMCLDRLDVFKPQLKALLRAAVAGNLKVMIPMVAEVDEVRAVKALIEDCRRELEAAGIAHAAFDLGIMVETPAAALTADLLAPEVAFFSIGTNDLTQYVMAADRLNPQVARLYRADHPAVLAAIRLVCEAAARAGIWVGVCGEAASRPEIVPALIGLGVSELSMSPASVLAIKSVIPEI